ncbi:MAG: hypothetical protein ABEJ22_09015 [Haloferacaceae archaeon]
MTANVSLPRIRPSRRDLLYGGLLVNTNLLFVALYTLLDPGVLEPLRFTVFGLLWIDVGLVAVAKTRVAPASRRTRLAAALVAGGYLLLLFVAGGLLAGGQPHPGGFRIAPLPPGWGPAPIYGGRLVTLVLMPSRVVGYVALAYLLYATVVDAAGAAVSGVLGLFSCVSCSWPILASVATGVFGSGSALAAAAISAQYGLSTAVFLVTVALLYWRPLVR